MRSDETMENGVLIAGGGPTGMMLGAELASAGVSVTIVERRPDNVLADARAGGFHPRTIEVLDQRGVADRFLAEGQTMPTMTFGTASLTLADLPTRHPYTLGLWQREIERIMAAWIDELPVRVLRRREVVGLSQDDGHVEVELDDGARLRAPWVVGCDGGRSVVRKAAGIGFPGWDATQSHLIAEVEMTKEPELGVRRDADGMHAIGRVDYEIRDGQVVFAEEGPVRVMLTDPEVVTGGEPTLDDVRAALVRVYGTSFGVHSPAAVSRFTDATRQAETYRAGRVLLAGDAAHVHYPAGGQGIGLGIQDAVNLGWKLAQVAHGMSPEALLDTYDAERRPVTARVLRHTMALTALQRTDDRTAALVEVVSGLAAFDAPRVRLAAQHAGLDVRYDLGDGHPLLGRRMPDLDLAVGDTAVRVFELLHEARPVLLQIDGGAPLDAGAWGDRVRMVRATSEGPWELPVLGEVPAPAAVLVRPDGHVAWVGDGGDAGLVEALMTWCGPRG